MNPGLPPAWKNACKEAGCSGKQVNDMQRSAVRVFERAGAQFGRDVGVGHKSKSIYRRYARRWAMQREAVALLDALDTIIVATSLMPSSTWSLDATVITAVCGDRKASMATIGGVE
jgi:hypothetical protein